MKQERDRSAEKVLYVMGWIGIGVMVFGILILKIFHIHLSEVMLPCIFKYKTGYYCPGCGGTRAVKYFLTGHILKSFIYHPLVPYLGIGGAIYMISHTLCYLTKGRIQGIRFRNIYAYAMIGILIVQFLFKNGLIYFFDYYLI